MLHALGCRIILEVQEDETIKEVRKAGLIAAENHEDAIRRGAGVDSCIVVAIGPAADSVYIQGIEIGDEVFFAKYAGKVIRDRDAQKRYVAINDEDLLVKRTR
jgi:co-chaperonin GroES (HSP10)